MTKNPIAEVNWADIHTRGYAVAPFLEPSEVSALWEVHRTTIPVVPMDYYPSGFGPSEARRLIHRGIVSTIGSRVEQLLPGYQVVIASFVTKKAHSTRGHLPLHQDYSLIDHNDHLGVNVWIPLSDVDDRNANLRMAAYSHRFGHISAMPPNPGAFSGLYDELAKRYLTSEPMAAGTACAFDTRILHATEENLTAENRVAAVLSLVPATATPRLHFWNADVPKRLEVYHIDTEFAWNMTPNTYPDEKAREGATFVETIDYDPVPWTLDELRERIPLPHRPALRETQAVAQASEPVVIGSRAAPFATSPTTGSTSAKSWIRRLLRRPAK